MTDDPCKAERQELREIAKEWVYTCGQKMSFLSVEPISSDVELRIPTVEETEKYKDLCKREQELFDNYREAAFKFNECVKRHKSNKLD